MSRQSKNARNIARRKANTLARKNGGGGAAKTAPLHGKRWTYRHNPEIQKRIAEQLKGTEPQSGKPKTSGKKILEGAGKAAQ